MKFDEFAKVFLERLNFRRGYRHSQAFFLGFGSKKASGFDGLLIGQFLWQTLIFDSYPNSAGAFFLVVHVHFVKLTEKLLLIDVWAFHQYATIKTKKC